MELSDYNSCWVLVHCCLILNEAIDKFIDGIVVNDYAGGSISDDPQDSVTKALYVFFTIGLPLSMLCMGMYCWRIHLYRENKNPDDSCIPITLWLLWFSFAKVWLEAFPQVTIATFYFGNCALKDVALVRAFDFFSMSPFIMFIYFTLHYYRTHEDGHYLITMLVLAVTFYCQ